MVSRSDELPGAHLAAFCQLIKLTERLVEHLAGTPLHSLFTVVPLMTQLLGLENPLFGSGNSPFSIISILPKLKDPRVVKWDFALSLEERRALIDDVYDMIAPCLLGEEEAYTELLVNTVHHKALRGNQTRIADFRQAEREKFAALAPLVHSLRVDAPSNFAQIAHYGYTPDLLREHGFLKHLPTELFEQWCAHSYPTVFELNFRGLGQAHEAVRGWILCINNSTEQLLNDHKLRKAKITQCARLAEKLGAQVVGMAGLIAFFGNGGYYLGEMFPELSLTTGHAYTIANILEIAKAGAARAGLELRGATVAVVGAAGSIGSGCAKLLAEAGVARLILIDILWQEHLAAVVAAVRHINPHIEVVCSNRLHDMRGADLSVVATNSPRTIIEPDYLKPGAIVIDDSFPKNIPETITKARADLIALEGGIVRLPATVEMDRARNVPNVMDVPLTRMISCREVYGCFAETMTLAAYRQHGHYGLGPADPVLAQDILVKAKSLGFSLAPLQFFGQAVSEQRFRLAAQQRNGHATD
jgi:fatty aldehyde-generating acyl-ACP reductase